jgi:hypothetical protein
MAAVISAFEGVVSLEVEGHAELADERGDPPHPAGGAYDLVPDLPFEGALNAPFPEHRAPGCSCESRWSKPLK